MTTLVEEVQVAAPTVEDLEKLTTVSLSDLMRAGSGFTKQSIQ